MWGGFFGNNTEREQDAKEIIKQVTEAKYNSMNIAHPVQASLKPLEICPFLTPCYTKSFRGISI
jgi:hypothetical protein